MTRKTYRRVISVGTGRGEDPTLVHVPEAMRAEAGDQIAAYIDHVMRTKAIAGGLPMGAAGRHRLCPGCTMSVVINALLTLAERNGWTVEYLDHHIHAALMDISRTGWTRHDARAKLEAEAERHRSELGLKDYKTGRSIEPIPSAELTQEERDAEQFGAAFYRFKVPGHDAYDEA